MDYQCRTFGREIAEEILDLRCNREMHLEEIRRRCALLTNEQQQIFNEVMNSVLRDDPLHSTSFAEDRPGIGKTFLIQTLIAALCADFHTVPAVCSSAWPATAYRRGRMAGYLFGIPATDDRIDLQSKLQLCCSRTGLIRGAKAIVWGELPTTNKAAWECVRCLGRRAA